jgi:hypothetical protein
VERLIGFGMLWLCLLAAAYAFERVRAKRQAETGRQTLAGWMRSAPQGAWSAIQSFPERIWRAAQASGDLVLYPERRADAWTRLRAQAQSAARWKVWPYLFEVTAVTAWALWVGRKYLDFNPLALVFGSDYPHQIQNHVIWNTLRQCGTCLFWNGSINGGSPAFADVQGATLHPLVILTTLIWGVVNGSKVILLASLTLAGLAQVWIGRVVGIRMPARLWAAAMVIVSGSIGARQESGLMNLVMAGAFATLTVAPLLDMALHKNKRSIVLFAIMLALAMIAGQGYAQVGILLALLPAAAVFFIGSNSQARTFRSDLVTGLFLAFLMVGILWVPLVHFWPHFTKEANPHISYAQLLEQVPLNYVLREVENQAIGKNLFLGWVRGRDVHVFPPENPL